MIFANSTEKCLKLLLTGMLTMMLVPVLPAERATASELADSVFDESHNYNNDAEADLPETNSSSDKEDDGESAAYTADTTRFSGVCGTCQWSISSSGVLTISEGKLDLSSGTAPWHEYREAINSVVTKPDVYAESTKRMFDGCTSLTSASLSNLDVSNTTDMSFMFNNCKSLTSVDMSGWDTSNVTDMSFMFAMSQSLPSADVSDWDTSKVASMSNMFYRCESLTSVDVSKWDTSSATNMGGIFFGCKSLESADVSDWNTSSATSLEATFLGCSSLKSVDVSGWDTSSATAINGIFDGCSSLTSIDVSTWDTSNVTRISSAFRNCKSLTSLDVSRWDTSNAESLSWMFKGCSSLASIDVRNWNTSKVRDMSEAFQGCSALESVDVATWNTSNVTQMIRLFENCSSISQINLSGFDTAQCTNMNCLFSGMSSLEKITFGSLFSFNGNGAATGCELPTPSGNGLTGLWYDADTDKAYSSSEIPNKHAATYVAQRSIDKSMFDVNQSDSVYTGSKIEKLVSSKNPLTNSDYQVSYENNQNVGTATIKIAGKGKYSGELLYSFHILQADPAFEAPAGLTAAYGQTLADVALPGGFSWQEDASTPVGAVGENAFHAVYTPADERNYKTVRDIEVAVRVSPATVAAPVLESMTFNGAEQIVGVPSSNLFTAIENSPERNAGRYEVIFRLNDKASYIWSSTENSEDLAVFYDIAPAKSTDISIEPIPQQQWTGIEITPTTTLKIGENTLQEGIDYVFDYKDNINEGTGIAIARSKGNISDDIEIPFTIARSEEPSPAPNPAPQPQPQRYDIIYHLDGGINATGNPATYTTGISVALADPTKKGFEFQGWFMDEEFKNQVTEIPAESKGTIDLWAKWSKLTTQPFPDVDYSSWYAPGVEFVQEKGLMTGYDDTGLFGVGKTLTRAEFATILWRHACPEEAAVYDPATAKDETGIAGSADGQYYTAAANWTVKNGIITGYIREDGTHDFAANDPVTFEQLITILARYSTNGAGANLTNIDLSAFLDGEKASDWAAPSLTWAAGKGLVQGYDTPLGKMLSPGEDVARERVAVVLMRAFELGLL